MSLCTCVCVRMLVYMFACARWLAFLSLRAQASNFRKEQIGKVAINGEPKVSAPSGFGH